MAYSQGRVSGYCQPTGVYVPFQPGQTPYFYYQNSGQYLEVTPANYELNLQYAGVYPCVMVGGQPSWLAGGTRFYVESPQTMLWFSDEGENRALGPGESAVYSYQVQGGNYETRPVTTQEEIAVSMRPGYYRGIAYANQTPTRWLSPQSWFYINNSPPTCDFSPGAKTISTFPPDLSRSQIFQTVMPNQPHLPPERPAPVQVPSPPGVTPPPAKSEPLQSPQTPTPPSSKPADSNPPSEKVATPTTDQPVSPVKVSKTKRKCGRCTELVENFLQVFDDNLCLECTLEKFETGDLKSARGNWSDVQVANLYRQLSLRLDETKKAQLPPETPLPIGGDICLGRDQQVSEGYPPKGHIVGKEALVVEDGCPNGHKLCKSCADKLLTCPVCGAFVPYKELPVGCPAHPGDKGHCAYFTKPCEAPGCDGGMWPKKQPPPPKKPQEKQGEVPAEPPVVPNPEEVKTEPKEEAKAE